MAVAQQQAKNVGKNDIEAALNDLSIIPKAYVGSTLAGAQNTIPILKDIIGGALKGGSKGLKEGNLINALIGTLGGASSGATTGLQQGFATAIVKYWQGKIQLN